jgi:hypothetical protein
VRPAPAERDWRKSHRGALSGDRSRR